MDKGKPGATPLFRRGLTQMAAWQGHPPSHQEVCDNRKESNRIPEDKFRLLLDGCQEKCNTLWYKKWF